MKPAVQKNDLGLGALRVLPMHDTVSVINNNTNIAKTEITTSTEKATTTALE